jgi:hypothetical protein
MQRGCLPGWKLPAAVLPPAALYMHFAGSPIGWHISVQHDTVPPWWSVLSSNQWIQVVCLVGCPAMHEEQVETAAACSLLQRQSTTSELERICDC